MAEVDVDREGPVLLITLNRAAKKNALTDSMYAELVEGIGRLEGDETLRSALVSGDGADFCAGNDIGDFLEPRVGEPQVERFLRKLPQIAKPIVAAVQGRAVGIGATMLLHFDLVYLATGAELRFPFVDIGLAPEAASTYLLPGLLGQRRAAEILLLCAPVDASRAVEYGLANEIVPADQLLERARRAAEELAAKPPLALDAARRLMRGQPITVADRVEEEIEEFKALVAGPEFAQ